MGPNAYWQTIYRAVSSKKDPETAFYLDITNQAAGLRPDIAALFDRIRWEHQWTTHIIAHPLWKLYHNLQQSLQEHTLSIVWCYL